jgi:hypothetical protein
MLGRFEPRMTVDRWRLSNRHTTREVGVMTRLAAIVLGFTAAGCLSCAQVPKEAVELSVTVGRDLAELHRANRELADRYFARMRQDVNEFVDDVYRPFVIRFTLDTLDLVEEIQRAARGENELDPLDIMEIYAEEVLLRITAFRDSMLEPIVNQERAVLDSIDAAYQRVQNASAVVTGHLASVRKVHDAQAEFLGNFGPADLRRQVSTAVSGLSDNLADVLEVGREVQEALDEGPARFAEVKQKFSEILERIRTLTATSST